MSKEKRIKCLFITDDGAREYMEKNHINGSPSQYNVQMRPDYSEEHVTYYNREDLVTSIVDKVNSNEISKGKKTESDKSKYITYSFKEKQNKGSNIIFELVIPKKLLNERGHYLDEIIKTLDTVTDTTIKKENNKKLSKFLAVFTGAAAAIGTIGGIMYGMIKITERMENTQDNRTAYEKYYEGIMPEYKFNELAERVSTNPTSTTEKTTYYYNDETNEVIQTTEEMETTDEYTRNRSR